MKTNRFLFVSLFSLFCLLGLNAQTFRQTIEWKGVQTWTTEHGQGKVLEFEGAVSMSSSSLPYYLTRIDVNDNFSLEDYTVSVENVRLMPLSDEEKQVVVQSGNALQASISPEIELVIDGYKKYLKVKFLPILQRNNSYRRVRSFEIDLQKKSTGSIPMRTVGALQLYPETLPPVIMGEEYWARFWVNDATLGASYRYTLSAGQLPDGLTLDEDWGYLIHEYDDIIGDYVPIVSRGAFTVEATDGINTISKEYTIITDCANIYLQFTSSNIAHCGVLSAGQFIFADNYTGEQVTLAESFTFAPAGRTWPEGLTLSADGLLQGTVTLPRTSVMVRATSASGCFYDAWLTIENQTVMLDNLTLRRGVLNTPYEEWLTATGGTAPYTYSATGLPQGLNISSSGKISGTSTTSGRYPVAITVTDNAGCLQTVNYELSIIEGSVLSSGNWYKIRIAETGNYTGDYISNNFTINYTPEKRMYKLTYEQLKAMEGINPDDDIRIFGYGGAMLSENINTLTIDDLPELPIHIEKGTDGIFNAGDYILFYTQGPISWNYIYDEIAGANSYVHTRNPYSNYGYYFVASGLGPALTAPLAEEESYSQYPGIIDSYPIRILHENESVNLASSGRNWYGEKFVYGGFSKYYNVNIPDYMQYQQVHVRANAVSKSVTTPGNNNNVMRIYYKTPTTSSFTLVPTRIGTGAAAQFLKAVPSDEKYAQAVIFKDPAGKPSGASSVLSGAFSAGNNCSFIVELRYIDNNSAAVAWLDHLTITTRAKLKIYNDQLSFDATASSNDMNNYNFIVDNVTNPATIVWDVTNPHQAVQMPATIVDSKLGFVTKMDKPRSFVAFNPKGDFPLVEPVGKVENQNLQTLKNVDYVIISPEDFVAQANNLANEHRTRSNLNVVVVTPEQVYNEFSSGTPDATAFRRLMKNVYETSPQNRANYLLLFGDGVFDNRSLTNQKNLHNYVLTYQAENSIHLTDSYLTDDYFGLVKGSEPIGELRANMDIGVGRITVNTALQAQGVVDKIIAYMNNTERGYWKKQLVFLADDGGNGDGNLHVGQAERVATLTAQEYPKYQIDKIYLDAYRQVSSGAGESYPPARERLHKMIKSGVQVLNFTGHGGPGGWTNENMMTNSDIQAMTNQNQGLWVAATCDFAKFDNPNLIGGSAGENTVLNPNGAAIALITATRTVYSDRNEIINRDLMNNVFKKDAQGNPLRLGDIHRLVKQNMAALSSPTVRLNSLSYVLLGDPAVTLTIPEYDVVTDLIKGQPATNSGITLSGLDVVEIKGHISDNGQLISNFNGVVQLNLYDRIVTRETLNNHNETNGPFSFTDRDRILSAKAEVVNGEFTVLFMMPRGISPIIGGGRLSYYASSETMEASGIFENFDVGGVGNEIDGDEDGPAMRIYLNTPDFRNGDKVNETPTFYAELSDPNGVNYSGSSSIFSIGSDMKIILNNGTEYIVNEYFEPDFGSYTSGMVTYTFPPLPAGKHHLVFTARDMLNNSSKATLEFEVVEGLSIFRVKAYPNPAKDFTTFGIEYNQPENVSQFDIKVYDLTGRLVYTETQKTVSNKGFDNWTTSPWGLTSSSGQRLQAGVYLYNAEVTTKSGKTSRSKTQRIIIQ